MKTYRLVTFMIATRWILLRMRNVSDKSCRENKNTYFVFINFFFPSKIVPVCEITWENVFCVLDTKGYKHTFTICDINYFSTTTIVAQTRLIVTLYIRCLYCCYNVCHWAYKHVSSAPMGRIFIKFYIWHFFEVLRKKIKGLLNSENNSRNFTWRPTVCTFKNLSL